ncbi:hypothetical protein [Kumtagia ephedrae]|uniref:Uncharacterized protein n=1 Tax=Kumtagia ephedrae TaxID=2116701 RepID=A0A2P7STL4_9HYPH|nr:hypothetical protein [Mesorhizobium ephedrae]PSJ65823.1 hypothetical protein C7I84_01500 [Mesorhizobium ephedrae]
MIAVVRRLGSFMLPILLLMAPAPVRADEARQPLPGVVRPDPIVKPLEEPIEPPRPDADGFVRMGDWDVRISGSVAVDITAGTLKTLPR